jgi:formylglycine-generating enzyme required for sulfatase activity
MSMIEMTLIKAGTFLMGSPGKDADRHDETQHCVTLTKRFYMGKYAVTQKQYEEVMGNNPSHFQGDNLPVETVSWYDALVFCNTLSIQEHLTPAYNLKGSNCPDDWGTVPAVINDFDCAEWDAVVCNWNADGYRLPTEAEWEYAAKGGQSGGADYLYAGGNDPDELAWYKKNSGETTHHVGKKKPNSLGLYDMSGNVFEWCWDWYDEYESGAQTDPRGASSGIVRVLRGGSWLINAWYLRSAFRDCYTQMSSHYNVGFRLVRSN